MPSNLDSSVVKLLLKNTSTGRTSSNLFFNQKNNPKIKIFIEGPIYLKARAF